MTTVALLIAGFIQIVAAPAALAVGPDLARFGTVTASAAQNDQDGNFPAANVIDGDPSTRWASGNGPNSADSVFTSWLQVDLGAPAAIDRVGLIWEAAYAVKYTLQVATADPTEEASWTTISSVDSGNGGTDEVLPDAPVAARYVRVNMLERFHGWSWGDNWYGYSLYSLEVNGVASATSVGFSSAAQSTPAGIDAPIQLLLNQAAAQNVSVRLRSTGGSAVAGTDFQAIDRTITFPAGATTASVPVVSVDHGPLAPVRTIELALSEPSNGLVLSAAATSTLTLRPHGDTSSVGDSLTIADFEGGGIGTVFPWGSDASAQPVLTLVDGSSVPDAASTNHALNAAVAAVPAGGWSGFSNDIDAPADWSAYDGFSFWFLGTGSGKSVRYELKSGGADAGSSTLFERSVVDDTAGWRQITVPFTDLRKKGAPTAGERFDPAAAHGFAVTLSDLGAGNWQFDDFAVYQRVSLLQDFEGDVPLGGPANPVGFFPWGNQDGNVTVGVSTLARGGNDANQVLSGDYQTPAGGYGGFSDNLATAQDWSSFGRLTFWWHASQDERPASPTAGADITVEIKDGGPDAEHAELWQATFKDSWSQDGSRWKLVSLPFSAFTVRTDYQAGSGATLDKVLSLTSAWGFAVTLPPGTAGRVPYAIDEVAISGSPAAPVTATVTARTPVVLLDQGSSGALSLAVTTPKGDPLPGDVTVTVEPGTGDAVIGTDLATFGDTITFPAGAESGTAQDVPVTALAAPGPALAKSLTVALSATGATVVGDPPKVVVNAHGYPYLEKGVPVTDRVANLMGLMSAQDKVGQMAQAERLGLKAAGDISRLRLGSLLSGGGSVPADNTPAGWADMVDGYQREALSTPLQIPLVYGVDAVHGHNNVVGATLFPHNIGLGATRDPALVERVGQVTANEVRATGIPWTFAPCLCVTRDERWGRSYESYGEDPALVTSLAGVAITGLQGTDPSDLSGPGKVLATAKHWVGDGGTRYEPALAGSGYPIDQGVTHIADQNDFNRLFVDPYVPAIQAGVGSIMPSYSAVQIGDGPVVRMHENTALNTDLLKDELGFDGFLISDWEGIDKLPGGSYAEKAIRSVNSGLDMAMAPYNYPAFITAVTEGVAANAISQARVDDAVRRILTEKFRAGLFDQPFADRSNIDNVGSDDHRAVARTAAAQSQVLLKNDGVLPLSASSKVAVTGSNADNLGNQMGGWSISWQGGSGATTTGTTILQGITAEVGAGNIVTDPAAADVGIAVVGETPYAEGQGDVGNNGKSLSLSVADQNAITACSTAPKCVVLVVAGRPQLVTDRLGDIDALVASWLPGTEGAGVSDTLFGRTPFTGRLPVTWPESADQLPINVGDADYAPLYSYGWGLRTDGERDRLQAAATELPAGVAKTAVQAAVDAPVWTEAGSVSDIPRAVRLLDAAAIALTGTDATSVAAADAVVSIVRDLAQQAVIAAGPDLPANSAALLADAEHHLMAGDAHQSVELLAQVLGVDPAAAAPTVTASLDPAVANGLAGWWTAPVAVTITAAGTGAGQVTITYQVDRDTPKTYTAPATIDVDGTHTVTYWAAQDGKESAHQQVQFQIDRTSPVASATVNSAARTVALTATDATSGVIRIEYQVAGQTAWTPYSAPIAAGPGGVMVTYRAVDTAGNTSAPATATVPPRSPSEQVMTGFDDLIKQIGVPARAADTLRPYLLAAGTLADQGRQDLARLSLALYQVQTLGLMLTRKVTPPQALYLLAYARTAATTLHL